MKCRNILFLPFVFILIKILSHPVEDYHVLIYYVVIWCLVTMFDYMINFDLLPFAKFLSGFYCLHYVFYVYWLNLLHKFKFSQTKGNEHNGITCSWHIFIIHVLVYWSFSCNYNVDVCFYVFYYNSNNNNCPNIKAFDVQLRKKGSASIAYRSFFLRTAITSTIMCRCTEVILWTHTSKHMHTHLC